MKKKQLVIVLPTYNEKDNVNTLIPKLFEVGKKLPDWRLSVLVVDDNSPDGTKEIVAQLQKKYTDLHLLTGKKQGLGKAYQRGFRYALDNLQPTALVEMDADWSHNPDDLPEFTHAIEQGADMVVGSRYMKGGSIPRDWGLHRKLFSRIGNWVARLGFMNLKQKEWTNGYRMIKAWLAEKNLHEMGNYNGYVFQIAFLDKAFKLAARVVEVPINFIDRTKGKSKISTGEYIFNIFLYIVLNSSFVKYVMVGSAGFIIDFGIAYLLINLADWPKVLSNILSAETAIISNFFLNNYWSFSENKITGGPGMFFWKLFIFNLISSGSLVIQGAGLGLALRIFGDTTWRFAALSIQSWITYKAIIIIFIIIPYSYFLYTKIVWKKK